MEIRELQRQWQGFGSTDPLWAVAVDPSKRGGKWDVEEFFALGEQEISDVISTISTLRIGINRGNALDFGCGVGRLTQALARRFNSVCGVDIAPSMIEHAQRFNRFKQCFYLVNDRDNLRIFPNDWFDFIYTNVVLQHMEPRYSKAYITEFIRVLKKEGVLVFQLPDRPNALPLDKSAYNARIRILEVAERAHAGQVFEVQAVVRNNSPVPWPGERRAVEGYCIQIGNHWLTESGRMEVLDDARTSLPHDLAPGAEVEFKLTPCAPSQAGIYLLELDMVHQCITWFQEAGSTTARIPVHVTPPGPAVASLEMAPIPSAENFVMEMYGVPRAEIEALVRDAGCLLAQVSESSSSGPEWIAWRYVVVKV